MKLASSILLLLALTGCTVHGADDKYRSGDDHIASIQAEAADAKWELLESKKAHGPAHEAHDASAFNHVGNIQLHASGAAVDFTDAAKQYGVLSRDYERDREKNKWIGWQTRHYWYVAVTGWAILGTIGIVAHFAGFVGVSTFIMRFLPFSNLFAGVRDWIQKRKDADKPTVKIEIQNAPAVRASAAQVVDAIDAAGPATTPADAAAT